MTKYVPEILRLYKDASTLAAAESLYVDFYYNKQYTQSKAIALTISNLAKAGHDLSRYSKEEYFAKTQPKSLKPETIVKSEPKPFSSWIQPPLPFD